ncbi:MAG TPA: PAS domain S-box protein [Stellaceae bacterium]|nr:PAS domain S-box protein [Stellaceae bacterium]
MPLDHDQICRMLVRKTAEGIIYVDGANRIRLWNDGATRIFGFNEGEALGQSLDIIIPENLRERHGTGFDQTMATGVTRYGAGDLLAVPALRKDGSRISIEFTILPFHDETGKIAGIGAVIRDVTARFAQTKELRKRIAELERR